MVTLLLTAVLAQTIGNVGFGTETNYKAVFTDATGLIGGDDVRIAGVKVGQVTSVKVVDKRHRAGLVQGARRTSRCFTHDVQARIRYRNLVGQRYVALTEGPGSRRTLPAGARQIPLARPSRRWT